MGKKIAIVAALERELRPLVKTWPSRKVEYEDRGIRKKALLGIGKLDVGHVDAFVPRAPGIEVLGGSSDHLILDITDDPVDRVVGDILEFDVRYSTMMYTTASRYMRVVTK